MGRQPHRLAGLLGDAAGGPDTPAYAAPARVADLAGLPPAYIEVGQLDIFRDEDLTYALRPTPRPGRRPVEFHLHPGIPHEFDFIAFNSAAPRPSRLDPFTDPRVWAAIVDRLTFGGNIIETGTDSYRLARTRARVQDDT